jgi:flagellar protein FliO/FliZ
MLAQADAVPVAGPDLVPNVWRMLGALAVVLALLGGLAWLLRRGAAARRQKGGLGIETALSLGERRSLVVVTVEGRRLLVGLAPNHVSLVTELQRAGTFDQALVQASGTGAPQA